MKIGNYENALAEAFRDMQGICGSEATFHALIAFHLRNAGLHVEMEFPEKLITGAAGRQRVDIAIFEREGEREPIGIIEIKGGAYGNRQAINDRIDRSGNCSDFAKLEALTRHRGIETMFIAVDLPILGRRFKSNEMIRNTFLHGAQYGVTPVIYAMEDTVFRVPAGEPGDFRSVQIAGPNEAPPPAVSNDHETAHHWLLTKGAGFQSELLDRIRKVVGHEANAVSCIYDTLRVSGLKATEVSLETYFSFADFGGKKMQARPDLCTYQSGFDGQFNLYRNGNVSQSNDAHKLGHLSAMVEVKSRAPGGDCSNKKFFSDLEKDIQKLARWRSAVEAEGYGQSTDYICFSADVGKTALPDEDYAALARSANDAGVRLVAVTRDEYRVW